MVREQMPLAALCQKVQNDQFFFPVFLCFGGPHTEFPIGAEFHCLNVGVTAPGKDWPSGVGIN
jgi:hypothetical protein